MTKVMNHEADRAAVFSRRAFVLGGAQVAVFGALAARLYYLQVVDAAEYATLADENRVNHRLILPERGRVLDRNGVALAYNTPTYLVRLIPERAGDIRETLEKLRQTLPLSDKEVEAVIAEARRHRAFVPITIREGLDWEEVAKVAVRAPELPGILLESGRRREYPYGDMLSHLLGYVAPVSESELNGDPLLEMPEFRIGKNGIEKEYDTALRGSAGSSRVEVNALGREIRELMRKEGEPGADIQLSIDINLQQFAHRRLSNELSASSVVVDTQTGAVLALASVPAYDPDDFTNGLSHRTWNELINNLRAPLVNKCIAGQYPPGSTFKMIVALAALEMGVVSEQSSFFCPGHLRLGSHRFHCWKKWGHGSLSLRQALAQSCDVYFYEVARKVGVDGIAAMARRFGLGDPTGIDLPGERPGLVPTKAWKRANRGEVWHQGETLVIGIGQGYMQTTPLQLAIMTARLASGRAIRPWLVTPPSDTPAIIEVSERARQAVLGGMWEVVNGSRGTARASSIKTEGVQMSGKTGTSQVRRITRAERLAGISKNEDLPWERRDHALFVCLAPSDAPRYAVSVVVDHGGGGSKAAAPIARDIMDRVLKIDPMGALSARMAMTDGQGA
ncbi:MAG: penicillin-binding protein 2 [Geminicoccaceae bacterium]